MSIDKSKWRLPIDHTHMLAASAGAMTFVGGAGDFDADGVIRQPDNLTAQIGGALDNLAAALSSEVCGLADVMRLKAFYSAQSGMTEPQVLAALGRALPKNPLPAISLLEVPMQPFAGQRIQLQAIAQRGWRDFSDVRVATRPVTGAVADALGADAVTSALRAHEFITTASRSAVDPNWQVLAPGEGAVQSQHIMTSLNDDLKVLGASLQDAIKLEGYYFGTDRSHWAPMAAARASNFAEPGPVATVVPCHALYPEGAITRVEVLAMREHRATYDKYITREDRWPARVWDWPLNLPYRQAIRLRDMIWLGGQVPAEPFSNTGARVLPGELHPQTAFTMSYIDDLLGAFGRNSKDLRFAVCHFTSDGSPDATRQFVKTLTDCMGGALPPMTLVPQPYMQTPESMVEIWGVAPG